MKKLVENRPNYVEIFRLLSIVTGKR